ncbi:taste receptor type 2 member 40-like [Hyperolius riggenbachi]|uniref:taste receptor type 2 member 40-like n=1 Tax=Hyperolius riggenbachi TaxID=752182 RepID=UPI0035A354ED
MDILKAIEITLIVLTWLPGVILNSSILAVYFKDLANSRHFSVCDKILLSTALLNIVQQCSYSVNGMLSFSAFCLTSVKKCYILEYFCNFSLIYGSFWHSGWLSIYYFFKLSKYSQRFFRQLKKTLSSSIVSVLIMTMLGVVFIDLPFIWTVDVSFSLNETTSPSGGNYQIKINAPFIVFNLVCGCCLPFLATLICLGLSVASLLGQVWRVQQNVAHFTSSPQIQGLLRAAKTMTLQLILNTLLCLTLCSMFLKSSPNATLSVFESFFISSFTSVQAMTSILGNPKLRKILFCQAVPS